jgi:putative PIN family toxin of toxin-antitoxin system
VTGGQVAGGQVIRVVIDTNVLVSGLLSPSGNEALIIQAVHQGLLRPCVSAAALAEYAEVLARPKFAFAPDVIAALMAMLVSAGELFVPQGPVPVLPDPDDAMFMRCAEAAQADYLVTGNKRHFPQAACGVVQVVSAGDLLERITLEI